MNIAKKITTKLLFASLAIVHHSLGSSRILESNNFRKQYKYFCTKMFLLLQQSAAVGMKRCFPVTFCNYWYTISIMTGQFFMSPLKQLHKLWSTYFSRYPEAISIQGLRLQNAVWIFSMSPSFYLPMSRTKGMFTFSDYRPIIGWCFNSGIWYFIHTLSKTQFLIN